MSPEMRLVATFVPPIFFALVAVLVETARELREAKREVRVLEAKLEEVLKGGDS